MFEVLSMTDLKFQILSLIYHSTNHEIEEIEVYKQNFGDVKEVRIAINDMLQPNPKPLIVRPIGKQTLKLTSAGNVAYEQAEDDRHQQAKEEAQQSFDNKVSIASLLIPLITFILGLIVEYEVNIIDWLFSLFS